MRGRGLVLGWGLICCRGDFDEMVRGVMDVLSR